jgi:hypothetical protein
VTMSRACAVIYQAHEWSAVHALRFERIRREAGELADCWILFHEPADPKVRAAVAAYPEARFFEDQALQRALGFPYFTHDRIVPGSAHYPTLEFSRGRTYDAYWLIESDVEYSGNWGELIARFAATSAHFVACHLKPYADTERVPWWERLSIPPDVPDAASSSEDWRTFAFLPVARFSAQALRTVDEAHQAGWRGHNEVLIASVLRRAGLEIADFNQFGTLYHPFERRLPGRDRHAHTGTMRWRPAISLNEFARFLKPDTLYHPIKAA